MCAEDNVCDLVVECGAKNGGRRLRLLVGTERIFEAPNATGIHAVVLVLGPGLPVIAEHCRFDTYSSLEAVEPSLATFVREVPAGRLVVLGINDSALKCRTTLCGELEAALVAAGGAAIRSYGGGNVKPLRALGYREAWAFAGVSGSEPGTAAEVKGGRNDCVHMQLRVLSSPSGQSTLTLLRARCQQVPVPMGGSRATSGPGEKACGSVSREKQASCLTKMLFRAAREEGSDTHQPMVPSDSVDGRSQIEAASHIVASAKIHSPPAKANEDACLSAERETAGTPEKSASSSNSRVDLQTPTAAPLHSRLDNSNSLLTPEKPRSRCSEHDDNMNREELRTKRHEPSAPAVDREVQTTIPAMDQEEPCTKCHKPAAQTADREVQATVPATDIEVQTTVSAKDREVQTRIPAVDREVQTRMVALSVDKQVQTAPTYLDNVQCQYRKRPRWTISSKWVTDPDDLWGCQL